MRAVTGLLSVATLCLQAQSSQVQRFTLPNGLRVIHLESRGHPMVRIWLSQRIGAGDIPADKAGLDALALRMLEASGAADLKAAQADRLLADAGVLLQVERAPNALTWKLTARNREQDLAMGLLADRVLRPIFDPAVLEAQRLACWQASGTPAALRDQLRLEPTRRPTEASLGTVGMEDLLAFRRRVFRPERAVLVLQGDLGLEQAKRLVLLSFGAWAGSGSGPEAPARPVTTAPAAPAGTPRLAIPVPGPTLRVEALAPRPSEVGPEVAALLAVLLQDEPGLQVDTHEGFLCLSQEAPPGAGGAALLARAQAQVDRLRTRTFSAGEVDRAKAAWLAGQTLRGLEPEAVMAEALDQALGKAPAPAQVAAVTPAALAEALQAWLAPPQVRWGVAGPPRWLAELTR